MKHLKTTAAILAMFIIAACAEHDQSTSNENNNASKTLHNEHVGAPINKDVALEWIANRKSRTKSRSREFYFKSVDLKKVLTSGRCTGVSFHYALDENSELHLLPIGTTADGKAVYTDYILDSYSWIALDRALNMIKNYNGIVRSHFFGANTFKRMVGEQRIELVRATLALDGDGNPQVLLSDGNVLNPDTYEDKSSPCPPVCPN